MERRRQIGGLDPAAFQPINRPTTQPTVEKNNSAHLPHSVTAHDKTTRPILTSKQASRQATASSQNNGMHKDRCPHRHLGYRHVHLTLTKPPTHPPTNQRRPRRGCPLPLGRNYCLILDFSRIVPTARSCGLAFCQRASLARTPLMARHYECSPRARPCLRPSPPFVCPQTCACLRTIAGLLKP